MENYFVTPYGNTIHLEEPYFQVQTPVALKKYLELHEKDICENSSHNIAYFKDESKDILYILSLDSTGEGSHYFYCKAFLDSNDLFECEFKLLNDAFEFMVSNVDNLDTIISECH